MYDNLTWATVTYFVSRTASDRLPAKDLMSVNKSAENLFRCGHVQDIIVCTANISCVSGVATTGPTRAWPG